MSLPPLLYAIHVFGAGLWFNVKQLNFYCLDFSSIKNKNNSTNLSQIVLYFSDKLTITPSKLSQSILACSIQNLQQSC
jgi:hypothetical protein